MSVDHDMSSRILRSILGEHLVRGCAAQRTRHLVGPRRTGCSLNTGEQTFEVTACLRQTPAHVLELPRYSVKKSSPAASVVQEAMHGLRELGRGSTFRLGQLRSRTGVAVPEKAHRRR